MGGPLEPAEAQAIEMPVPKNEDALSSWFRHGRRRSLPVLHADGVLSKRVAELQPPFGSDKDGRSGWAGSSRDTCGRLL